MRICLLRQKIAKQKYLEHRSDNFYSCLKCVVGIKIKKLAQELGYKKLEFILDKNIRELSFQYSTEITNPSQEYKENTFFNPL